MTQLMCYIHFSTVVRHAHPLGQIYYSLMTGECPNVIVSYFLIAVRREQIEHYIKTKMHNIQAWAMYTELKNSRLVSAIKLKK